MQKTENFVVNLKDVLGVPQNVNKGNWVDVTLMFKYFREKQKLSMFLNFPLTRRGYERYLSKEKMSHADCGMM